MDTNIKIRAKILNVFNAKNYAIIEIDTDIPGIISYSDRTYRKSYVRRFITTKCMTTIHDVGRTIDIVLKWYNAGEEYNGHILKHDCYIYDFDYVD